MNSLRIFLITFVAIIGLIAPIQADSTYTLVNLAADLSAEQVPSNSTASGTGVFSYNITDKQFNYTIGHNLVLDANDTTITVELRGPAKKNENSTTVLHSVIVDNESSIQGHWILNDQEQGYVLNGTTYIILKTFRYPEGEIRGQIEFGPDIWEATLKGENVIPPVQTNATGEAIFHYNNQTRNITCRIEHNVFNATKIGIYRGDEDEEGDLVKEFEKPAFLLETNFIIDEDQEEDFLDNEFYIIVFSGAHPSGEIRGQLIRTGTETSDDDDDGLSTTAIVIIVIVVIVIVLAIILGVVFYIKRRKKQKFEVVDSERGTGDYVPPSFAEPLLHDDRR